MSFNPAHQRTESLILMSRNCRPFSTQSATSGHSAVREMKHRIRSSWRCPLEPYQSKTVRHGPNCSYATVANFAARMRCLGETYHGNGDGNLQERRTRQLRMGGD